MLNTVLTIHNCQNVSCEMRHFKWFSYVNFGQFWATCIRTQHHPAFKKESVGLKQHTFVFSHVPLSAMVHKYMNAMTKTYLTSLYQTFN